MYVYMHVCMYVCMYICILHYTPNYIFYCIMYTILHYTLYSTIPYYTHIHILYIVQHRHKGSDGKNILINQRRCRDAVKQLMNRYNATPFNQPVDPILLCIPEYTTIIHTPMDLGTVRDKLRANCYCNMLEFVYDIRLTFNNAMLFNPPTHPIHQAACILLQEFECNMVTVVKETLGASSTVTEGYVIV